MIYYSINLNRSRERYSAMEEAFAPNCLTRIAAVEGLDFSDGTFDEHSRPCWNSDAFDALVRSGHIHRKQISGREMYPTEFGCALSHIRCWQEFLNTGQSHALFMEDDVEPTERGCRRDLEGVLNSIPQFHKADMFFPISPSEPWRPIRLHSDGTVQGLRSHMAYTLTRRAAEILVENVFPLVCAIDAHVGFRFLEGMRIPSVQRRLPSGLKTVPSIKAYGMPSNPLIRPCTETARQTTFTSNGRKDWIPEKYKEPWVA